MSLPVATRPFPRGALVVAAVMVLAALAAAVQGRIAGAGPAADVAADTVNVGHEAVATRDLRFEDRADGAVVVRDLTGREVAVMAPGTNGFLRATLRGLARERRREDLGPETPFRLATWAEGGITLQDLSTGRQVHLAAFGQTNAAVFARLLHADGAGR